MIACQKKTHSGFWLKVATSHLSMQTILSLCLILDVPRVCARGKVSIANTCPIWNQAKIFGKATLCRVVQSGAVLRMNVTRTA